MNNYGAMLRELGRPDEAEPWFVRAATAGSEAAAENLRRTLWKRGVRPGDIGWAEEARWFTPAAEAGQILAARWLRKAAMKHGKEGLAEHWELWGAHLGDPISAWLRGVRLGRRKEYDEAERWLQQAADGGEEGAAALLAEVRAARAEQASQMGDLPTDPEATP